MESRGLSCSDRQNHDRPKHIFSSQAVESGNVGLIERSGCNSWWASLPSSVRCPGSSLRLPLVLMFSVLTETHSLYPNCSSATIRSVTLGKPFFFVAPRDMFGLFRKCHLLFNVSQGTQLASPSQQVRQNPT